MPWRSCRPTSRRTNSSYAASCMPPGRRSAHEHTCLWYTCLSSPQAEVTSPSACSGQIRHTFLYHPILVHGTSFVRNQVSKDFWVVRFSNRLEWWIYVTDSKSMGSQPGMESSSFGYNGNHCTAQLSYFVNFASLQTQHIFAHRHVCSTCMCL